MKIEVIPILTLKKHGATSTLLILEDSLHILLDCGLNQKLDFKRYDVYWNLYINKVDIILLSHTGVEYTGALPFICKKLQQHPQIYCTPPIKNFGLFNLYDSFLNIEVSNEAKYDNEQFFKDIHRSFDECQEIRFQQLKKVKLTKKTFQYEVTLSCQGAGNSLGACIWTIKCNLLNIMYLVSYNHYDELHLDGIDFKQLLKNKIDVLITDSNHNENIEPILVSSQENRKKLKQQLTDQIQKTLDSDANLILVCYPNERIIEIVFLIHQIAQENPKLFEKYKVDFYRNYKQYLDQFQKQSSFMKHEAEVALQQKSKSPFIQQQIIDEDKKKIEPFLNVRKDLVPDNEENNKIVLTTYNVLFIGPLYNYLLGQLASNPQNQLFIIGRPDQDLFEATLQIKNGFSGELNLKKKEQDKPLLNALQEYIIQEPKQNEEIEIEKDGQETDLQSIQNKIETKSIATTAVLGTKQNPKKPLLPNQSEHSISEIQKNLFSDQRLSYQQLQQQENEQQQQMEEEHKQGEQEEEKEENGGSVQAIEDQDDQKKREQMENDLDELEQLKLGKQNQMLFTSKKFPKFYNRVETVTLTDYGHDNEGYGQSKLYKHNVAKLIKISQGNTDGYKGSEIVKQLYQNFVKLDMLQTSIANLSSGKISLNFQMQVTEFPLKGISDMNSSINIIQLINPKQIVLVNGNKLEQEDMKLKLKQKFLQEFIHIPTPGQVTSIELPNESLDIENFDFFQFQNDNNNSALMKNKPEQSLKKVEGSLKLKYFKESEKLDINLNLNDQNLASLNQKNNQNNQNQSQEEEEQNKQQQQLALQQQQEQEGLDDDDEEKKLEQEIVVLDEVDLRSNQKMLQNEDEVKEFFGEYKYEKLMKILIENQIKCQVQYGILSLYEGRIQISKNNTSFQIEGTYGPEYFKVRKLLYSFLESQQNI